MKHETVELTSAQLKLWSDTRAALVWQAPAFTHIFYNMMSKEGGEHLALFIKPPEMPNGMKFTAATDGRNILINPETFFPLSLSERVFVVAHEISHGVFAHCELMQKLKMKGEVKYPDGKVIPYDQMTMNKAMDYVINDMLIDSKIGSYNKDWLHDPQIATYKDDVLLAYRRIYQDDPKNGGAGRLSSSGNGKGQSGFDDHLQPGSTNGQDPNAAANGRNDMEWKTAIAGAIATAKAMGKLPASLERLFSETLESTVDWTDRIIGWFARKPGGGGYDWKRLDRRLLTRGIGAPARSGFGCGPVVVGVDTSGSIGQKELDTFFGNMAGILDDIRPSALYIMWCDAHVHRVDEVADMMDLHHLRQSKAPGGGGTAFEPVFTKIEEMGIEPEALIYLTDGYGSFPSQAPLYPVMWGAIAKGVNYPWGEVVEVPIR